MLPDTVRVDLKSGAPLLGKRVASLGNRDQFVLDTRREEFLVLRDEVFAVQLLVEGSPGTYLVASRMTCSPETRDESKRPVTRLFEAYPLPIEEPSAGNLIHSLGPGLYPDPLLAVESITLHEKRRSLLWLDIFVPRNAGPTQCNLTVTVGEAVKELRFRVSEVALPTRDVARLGTVNFGSLVKRGAQAERAWMQMAHAHGLSVEVLRPRAKLRGSNFDWRNYLTRYGGYFDGSAFSAKAGYLGPRENQPTSRFIIPPTDWWPSKATNNRPEDVALFQSALRSFERLVEKAGWQSQENPTEFILFINSLDEPKSEDALLALKSYGKILDEAGLTNRDLFSFRVDGNFGQWRTGWSDDRMATELGPVVDIWNVHGAPATIPMELLRARLRVAGERTTVYISNTSGEPAVPPLVLDAPLTGARALAYIVYRYGLAGAMNWEIDLAAGCIKNPRCSEGGYLNLDANLAYRGEELGLPKGTPVPSIRLKALRRGIQDVAILSLVEEKDPQLAKRIAKAIIPRALGDGVREGKRGQWPADPRVYDKMRNAMIDILEGRGTKRAGQLLAKNPPGTNLSSLLLKLLLVLISLRFVFRSRKII